MEDDFARFGCARVARRLAGDMEITRNALSPFVQKNKTFF